MQQVQAGIILTNNQRLNGSASEQPQSSEAVVHTTVCCFSMLAWILTDFSLKMFQIIKQTLNLHKDNRCQIKSD